ncbi:MAG: hypothetical protein JWP76_1340 [Dactylosporangium sp.]|jgi:hypothetical protein|nr:hypothetical protein [Dactylosporangium sp.]
MVPSGDVMAEAEQLALDAPVSPPRILSGQPDDQTCCAGTGSTAILSWPAVLTAPASYGSRNYRLANVVHAFGQTSPGDVDSERHSADRISLSAWSLGHLPASRAAR